MDIGEGVVAIIESAGRERIRIEQLAANQHRHIEHLEARLSETETERDQLRQELEQTRAKSDADPGPQAPGQEETSG